MNNVTRAQSDRLRKTIDWLCQQEGSDSPFGAEVLRILSAPLITESRIYENELLDEIEEQLVFLREIHQGVYGVDYSPKYSSLSKERG